MRTRYWIWGAGGLLLALCILVWAGGGKAEAQVITMKFAHYAAETHPGHLAAKQFATRVEERTKGQIKISTRQMGDDVEIRIIDTGPGIPEELISRVFDPFFTTKPPGKGTGQGLAIAYRVVMDKHGGHLSVENLPGQGACFVIRLPLKESGRESQEQ